MSGKNNLYNDICIPSTMHALRSIRHKIYNLTCVFKSGPSSWTLYFSIYMLYVYCVSKCLGVFHCLKWKLFKKISPSHLLHHMVLPSHSLSVHLFNVPSSAHFSLLLLYCTFSLDLVKNTTSERRLCCLIKNGLHASERAISIYRSALYLKWLGLLNYSIRISVPKMTNDPRS